MRFKLDTDHFKVCFSRFLFSRGKECNIDTLLSLIAIGPLERLFGISMVNFYMLELR